MLQRIRTTRFALLALLASVALLVALPVSGIAAAHDQLVESNPTDGQEFEASPTEVTLRFSAEMLDIGTELALQNTDTSELVELTEPLAVNYDTVSQPLPELAAGAYALNWRVVSQDGHPISGTINFTVAGAAAEEPAAGAAESTSGTEPTSGAEESAGGFGNAPNEDEGPQPSGQVNPATPSGLLSEPWMVVVLSVVAVLVAAGAIVTFVMRMRRGNTPGE